MWDEAHGGLESQKRRLTMKPRFTLLDATHELTPEGKIRKVWFRKFMFYVRKFLRDIFGTSFEPH